MSSQRVMSPQRVSEANAFFRVGNTMAPIESARPVRMCGPHHLNADAPQKALRGDFSGAFLEPLMRICQLLAEKCPGFLKYV